MFRYPGRLALPLLAACSSPAPPLVAAPPPAPGEAAAPAPRAPPPLGPREQEALPRLERVVRHLTDDVGERHAGREWALATATDDLAGEIEALGLEVRRQGLPAAGAVVQNLEVRLRAGRKGGEVIALCARYDTAPGRATPGDAAGAALLVELARALAARAPSRSVRLVLLANEAAPPAGSEPGSLVYGKALSAEGARVLAVIVLDALGGGAFEIAGDASLADPIVGSFAARGLPARREPARAADAFAILGLPSVRISSARGRVALDHLARTGAAIEEVVMALAETDEGDL